MSKKRAIALALAVGLGFLPAVLATEAGKTHDVNAEVVSVDTKANTITVKDESGKTQTWTVLEEARDSLKNVKAGDKCTFTCKDNEKGEHQGVKAIRKSA